MRLFKLRQVRHQAGSRRRIARGCRAEHASPAPRQDAPRPTREVFDWRAHSSTIRRQRSRVAKSLRAWIPAGSSRRIASIRLTASTIFGYCSSESWRKLPIALAMNIRSFASSACSRRMMSARRAPVFSSNPFLNRSKRRLFLMQLLAETRDEMRRQFGHVTIQLGDDLARTVRGRDGRRSEDGRPKNRLIPFDAGAGSSTPTTAAASAGAPGATSAGTPTTRQWSKETAC